MVMGASPSQREQRFQIRLQAWQLALHRLPDASVVERHITLHQHISETDDLGMVAHPRSKLRIDLGQLRQCFAQVLHLALYR